MFETNICGSARRRNGPLRNLKNLGPRQGHSLNTKPGAEGVIMANWSVVKTGMWLSPPDSDNWVWMRESLEVLALQVSDYLSLAASGLTCKLKVDTGDFECSLSGCLSCRHRPSQGLCVSGRRPEQTWQARVGCLKQYISRYMLPAFLLYCAENLPSACITSQKSPHSWLLKPFIACITKKNGMIGPNKGFNPII